MLFESSTSKKKIYNFVKGHQIVRVHSIHMPVNWRLVYKIVMHNGLKMITNELKRVALARVVVIVVAHRRHIHPEAVHMVEMEMVMHQIWAPYQHPRVCSIQHQVSISLFHIGPFIEIDR